MIEQFLRRKLRHKELGWKDIGEKFTRYAVLKTRWFNVYLHQLHAPQWESFSTGESRCHDHPWWFITCLLRSGYLERIGTKEIRRYPGQILYRPATFKHAVITPYGTAWSLILTGPTVRKWGYKTCE